MKLDTLYNTSNMRIDQLDVTIYHIHINIVHIVLNICHCIQRYIIVQLVK